MNIGALAAMCEVPPSSKYLGLPVLLGCSHQKALAAMKDCIKAKTQS